MRANQRQQRRLCADAHAPAALFESLEPRVHLTAFAYTSLMDYLDANSPLLTLRPSGEDPAARTIASAVAPAGDVNGDGVDDVIVGAGGVAPDGGPSDSIAAVYSGATGQLLHAFRDGAAEFGAAVAGLGDVNGDGHADLAVGSPRFNGGVGEFGRVYVYSGLDGSVIRTLEGQGVGHRFGEAIAAAGDVNGDGVADLVVGAPGAAGSGAAYLFSGASGQLLHTLTGGPAGGRLGSAVSTAGDINNDGRDDVIVGAPAAGSGSALIFSGRTGALLRTLTGAAGGERFGAAVAGGHDLSGDNVPDVAVGAPAAAGGAGRLAVFSGAGTSVLFTIDGGKPGGSLGASLAFAGDADADGTADLLVGEPSQTADARVLVISGDEGTIIGEFVSHSIGLVIGDRVGVAVAPAGDVNGDGATDFLLASTQDLSPDGRERARMYVFSGASMLDLLPTGIADGPVIWGEAGDEGFLVLNGEFFLLPSRGFNPGDRVIDINKSRVVLGGRDLEGFNPFIWQDGDRRALTDLIQTYDGPEDTYSRIRAVDITDSGLVLVERITVDNRFSTWLYDDGVLTYLFDGSAVKMNEARTVLGRTEPEALSSFVWTPQGGTVAVPGFGANDINELGLIVGSVRGEDTFIYPALLRNGQIEVLDRIHDGNNFFPHTMNDSGWIVGRYTDNTGATRGFFYNPEEGVIMDTSDSVTAGDPPALDQSRHVRLSAINNEGVIIGRTLDNGLGFILTPIGRGPVRALAGNRMSAAEPPGSPLTAITINLAQEVLAFQRDPATGRWSAINLTGSAGAPRVSDAVTFTDPASGRVAYGAVADDGVYLILQQPDGEWTVRNLTAEAAAAGAPATSIVRGLTTFTSLAGVAYLAGIDGVGDVVAYTSADGVNDDGLPAWRYENLSAEHLRPNGFATPSYHGGLVSYVTSWDGLNIAGLDENGDIWTVWTAPEIAGQWRSENLSRITGAPVLVGGLAPFLAPWGAIHIAGTDVSGDTTVTWWVPGFGGEWAKNNLTQEYDFVQLRPESVSSFVTGWGALNIIGLDDRGETSIYWWVPETSTWLLTHLDLERPDRSIRPVGRLDGFAGSQDSMSLFGAGPNGEILRMHWRPDQEWLFENLTTAVQ